MPTSDDYLAEFPFQKHELRLAYDLQISEKIVCLNRTVSSRIEGLCVLLQGVTYPTRYYDLVPWFGRSMSELFPYFQ